MTYHRRASGFTLIEAMAAMAVLVLGAVGITSLERMGPQMNADARMMTFATAVAKDLVSQIQTWDYATEIASGGRLENTTTANDNDADFADAASNFEKADVTGHFDHDEDDLSAGGGWLGIPTTDIQGRSDIVPVERYWNVAPFKDPTTGTVLGTSVAVIVRWDRGGSFRRVVLTTFARDPSVTTSP